MAENSQRSATAVDLASNYRPIGLRAVSAALSVGSRKGTAPDSPPTEKSAGVTAPKN